MAVDEFYKDARQHLRLLARLANANEAAIAANDLVPPLAVFQDNGGGSRQRRNRRLAATAVVVGVARLPATR